MISKKERKEYRLCQKKNCEVLEKIHELEKFKLSKEDKEVVKLIRTQLRDEWRKPLHAILNKKIKKYKGNERK